MPARGSGPSVFTAGDIIAKEHWLGKDYLKIVFSIQESGVRMKA
jgi:hypothetical protein